MELITAIITDIRRLRAEYKVEPAKKIHATIYAGEHLAATQQQAEAITRLARLEKLELVEKGEKVEGAASAICQGVEIHLPLNELVDPEKEKNRLKKELERVTDFIAKIEGKLNNENFTSKAPANVVEREKAQLAEQKQQANKIKNQLDQL